MVHRACLLALCLVASCGEALKLSPSAAPGAAAARAADACSRRAALGGLFAASAFVAPTAASAVLDARGNQLSGLSDRTGPLDVVPTPFSAVVDGVRKALEAVGVEKEKPPPVTLRTYGAAPVERPYAVGRRPGSDRLQKCPPADVAGSCASSAETDPAGFTVPLVYYSQKGQAVGDLLAFAQDDPRWSLLGSDGNFFNGQGVYVLAEYRPPGGQVFDCEFGFLPNVLESTVDVRVVQRSPKAAVAGGSVPAQGVVAQVARAMGWVPLSALPPDPLDAAFSQRASAAYADSNAGRTYDPALYKDAEPGPEDEEVYKASEAEWRIRNSFEKELEAADLALQAQMDDETQSVARLKAEISKLLDQLQLQDDKREREALALRRRLRDAREQYYEGVLKRQGSYRNSGTYGGTVSRQSAGSSIGVMINKDEGVMQSILKNGKNKLD